MDILLEYDEFEKSDIQLITNSEDVKRFCNEGTEVLFQDIELESNESGIELAKYLKEKFPNLMLIFFSSYSEYSQAIFEANPDGFLLKSFEKKNVDLIVRKIIDRRKEDSRVLTIDIGRGKTIVINLRDISYITKDGNNIVFMDEDDREAYSVKYSMKDLESLLPEWFVRTHTSYYVNMKHIRSIEKNKFILQNEKIEIPVSHSYRKSKDEYIKYIVDAL